LSHLSSPTRTWALRLLRRKRASAASDRLFGIRSNWTLELGGRGRLARAAIPVPNHLRSEHSVKSEAGNEAVQDEWVRNFLQGGEDAA